MRYTLTKIIKIFILLSYIILLIMPLSTATLSVKNIINNNYTDTIELKIYEQASSINPYFNKSELIHTFKMYHEYKVNNKVYLRIPIKYRWYVLEYCTTNEDLPVLYAYAFIQHESGWCERAVGRNGYISHDDGLGQINSLFAYIHARSFFKSGPLHTFDVHYWKHNLEVSFNLMKSLLIDFDYDFYKAMMAYNAGYYAVIYNRIPVSTYNYVKCVKRIMYSI